MLTIGSLRAACGLTVLAVATLAGSAANAQVVFQNSNNNGFFQVFSSSTSSSVRYGDGGWMSNGSAPGLAITRITLGMAMTNSTRMGSTKINFTLNDGDPSGLVFGSGAALYSTTINFVELPDTSESGSPTFFNLVIDLPAVQTLGGFNNIGWSIGVQDFDSDGLLGFQCATGFDQSVGFYTNNASYYNGSSWSLFSFGGDPNTGVANFTARIEIPTPGALALLGGAGLIVTRRRRTA